LRTVRGVEVEEKKRTRSRPFSAKWTVLVLGVDGAECERTGLWASLGVGGNEGNLREGLRGRGPSGKLTVRVGHELVVAWLEAVSGGEGGGLVLAGKVGSWMQDSPESTGEAMKSSHWLHGKS
jgi:hypothetical protein